MFMNKRMRVLLVGSFRIGHLAASYQRAFETLGHEVVRFDVNAHKQSLSWWLQSRFGHRLLINNLSARRLGSKAYNQALFSKVQETKPELLIAFNGPLVMPETVQRVRQRGVKFIFFQADNPFPPNYNARPETLLAAKECDAFLIWSTSLVEMLRNMGIPAGYLPFGWDELLMPFQGLDNRLDYDVTFVGGWDRQRELFLEGIARHFNLKIWGPAYWGERTRRNSRVRQCWQGRGLQGSGVAEVFARSHINLNILREQHYVGGKANGVIMRTLEAPGAGGFLLSTRSSDATELFPENEAAGYFSDFSDCLERIEHFLSNDGVRKDAVQQAHALVDANHHYVHRIKDLLYFISG